MVASIWGAPETILPESFVTKIVNSVASLRGVDHTKYSFAHTTGYAQIGDGGGADYYYDPTDTVSVDNGGNVIVDALGGRWKLLPTGGINLRQFGVKGNAVTDDFRVFQAAIDALPALGGRIIVPEGTYYLSAIPSIGTKSVYWDFSPGTTFTGPGTGQNKFPSMKTNGGQMPVGPYIFSQSRNPYNLNNGGVAAFQIEMIQPVDVIAQSVALYVGASGSNPSTSANVWAINPLIRAEAGAGGTYQGIEMDVDCFSDIALVKGISINGIGTANPDVGLELIRSDATRWNTGIDIMNAIKGIQVRNTAGLTQGITSGEPTAQASVAISGKQLKNGGDGLVLQRFTDTAFTGSLIRGIDAANSATVFNVDAAGQVTGKCFIINGGAVSAGAGTVVFGNTTTTVATAGTAVPIPAAPAYYLAILIGSTQYKIPLFNA